ncbi:MAG TPA: hypothetical protein VK773_03140 [Acidimicrobiales bacterium]|nr:hypothetical protein [Acidimicrobiales bacterium]
MNVAGVVRRIGASRRVRIVQLVALAGLVVGLGGIAATSGAGADTGNTGSSGAGTTSNTNTYNLSAQANALDVLLTDSSLPLSGDLNYEVGPWGASASLNSLGESISDAGAPYSPSIASLPGTINGLGAGNLPPLPPLPGYVSASYPSNKAVIQSQAGYDIAATAQANTSKGAVGLGVQPSGSPNPTFFANAETTANPDGSVTLSASAGMDLLDFGQLLDLGNVSSSLSMTQQANQQPKVTSQTTLGTITLLGASTGLLGKEASVLGVGVPIDINTELIGTLNTLLAKTGIKLTYLPVTYTYADGTSGTGSSPDSTKTLQAVDSGALQVTFSQNVPSQGQVTLSATLGRVYLSTTDTPGIGPTTGNSGVVAGNTGTAGTSSSSPSVAVAGNTGTVTGNSGPSPTSQPVASPAPSGGSLALANGPAYLVEHGPPIESVYLVLVLAALGLLLASQAARYLAVRLALSGRGP